MAQRTRVVIISAGLLIGTIGGLCMNASAIDGSNKITNQSRKLAPYHRIKINLPAEITCDRSSTNEITIETDDNLLPHIKTTVKDGELLIENDESFNNSHKMKIQAKAANIDAFDASGAVKAVINNPANTNFALEAAGASRVSINNLSGGKFGINATGAANIMASGNVDTLSADLRGAGSIKATSLAAKSASVTIGGTGNAEVNAINNLNVSISGVGSVKYKGNPKVTQQVNGLGTVKQI
jgi:hypothetical protein